MSAMTLEITTTLLTVGGGFVTTILAYAAFKTLSEGVSGIRQGRRDGLGLGAFVGGELPHGRDRSQIHCANGVSGQVESDGSVTYHKKARLVR